MKSILFLEDDESLRGSFCKEFQDRGYAVTGAVGLTDLKTYDYDYAVVDLRLGPENGLHVVSELLRQSPKCRLVVLTGYASVATAVEAIKLGAVDYLAKPVSVNILEKALLGELKSSELQEEMLPLAKHEHEYIEFVVTQNKGNISRSAKVLGLHRSSLQRKMKKNP